MHEFSICKGLVEVVIEEYLALHPPPLRLNSVRVIAGALHQLVPEFMDTAYDLLTKDTPAAGSRLELIIQPIAAECPACGWAGTISPPFFRCGDCDGTGIKLVAGREFFLDGLNVEPANLEETG